MVLAKAAADKPLMKSASMSPSGIGVVRVAGLTSSGAAAARGVR